jgi:hypothetical protein
MKQKLVVRTNNIFGEHQIVTGGVFVTELSRNAGISVRRIVWVTTDCRLMNCVVGDFSCNLVECQS